MSRATQLILIDLYKLHLSTCKNNVKLRRYLDDSCRHGIMTELNEYCGNHGILISYERTHGNKNVIDIHVIYNFKGIK